MLPRAAPGRPRRRPDRGRRQCARRLRSARQAPRRFPPRRPLPAGPRVPDRRERQDQPGAGRDPQVPRRPRADDRRRLPPDDRDDDAAARGARATARRLRDHAPVTAAHDRPCGARRHVHGARARAGLLLRQPRLRPGSRQPGVPAGRRPVRRADARARAADARGREPAGDRAVVPDLVGGDGKFLQQRIRYAYEMLKHPGRALLYVAVAPTLALLLVARPAAAVALAVVLTIGAALLGLVGQWRYPRLAPAFTWLLAPVYFWFIPFAMWLALAFHVTGGMPYGADASSDRSDRVTSRGFARRGPFARPRLCFGDGPRPPRSRRRPDRADARGRVRQLDRCGLGVDDGGRRPRGRRRGDRPLRGRSDLRLSRPPPDPRDHRWPPQRDHLARAADHPPARRRPRPARPGRPRA